MLWQADQQLHSYHRFPTTLDRREFVSVEETAVGWQKLVWIPLLVVFTFLGPGCNTEPKRQLSPEEQQAVAELKQDLGRIQGEIDEATAEDAKYAGGLIKSLIAVRLEILKTNSALVEQRIHSLETGSRVNVVVNTTKRDPERAAELAKEIESQKAKVADARRDADRYSGGLVQALSETTVVTARSTLVMLEQQYMIAKYGLALPAAPTESDSMTRAASTAVAASGSSSGGTSPATLSHRQAANTCLKVESYDSSTLSTNSTFTEVAWKADIANSCDQPFVAQVTFTLYDKDEFELESDSETIQIPPKDVGKARGKMLVSPPEKAQRMARHGVQMSLR